MHPEYPRFQELIPIPMNDYSNFRSKSIGVRVTEADFTRLQSLADAQGKPMGEWCRDVLLGKLEGSRPSPIEQILLGEVLALRTILLNVLFSIANREAITAEEMKELIKRADREKLKKALTMLEQGIDTVS
jgi:hypothetical protein